MSDTRQTIRTMLTEADERGPRIRIGDTWVNEVTVSILIADEGMANQVETEAKHLMQGEKESFSRVSYNFTYVDGPYEEAGAWKVDISLQAISEQDGQKRVREFLERRIGVGAEDAG